MPAVLLRSHDRDATQDAPSRLVAVIEERGQAAPRVVGGARDQDEMVGDAGAGDEPFVAVDHPAVALPLRAGADHAGIGAAARRGLGHGEGGPHLALDDGPEPSLLLRRRSDERDEVHIAVVGRRAIERERAEDRAVGLLVHRRPADDRQRHAAVGLRRLRRPQARGLGLGLHGAQQVEADVLVVVVVGAVGFERQHVLLDEAARAQADVLDLGRKGEVHWRYPLPAPTSWPPSTTMVVPAMKRPASETRRSSAPSRSRSSPKRPTGISRLIAAPCSLRR